MPKRSEEKLTEAFVKKAVPDPDGKDLTFFFRDVPGLGLRVKPSGVKTYFLQYRDKYNKRQRKIVIGRAWSKKQLDGLNPTRAIDVALKLRVAVKDGADPAAERDGNRNAKTVSQLCDEHMKATANVLKASTLALDKIRIETHVKPLLGSRAVASLTRDDLEKFLADVSRVKMLAPARNAVARPLRHG